MSTTKSSLAKMLQKRKDLNYVFQSEAHNQEQRLRRTILSRRRAISAGTVLLGGALAAACGGRAAKKTPEPGPSSEQTLNASGGTFTPSAGSVQPGGRVVSSYSTSDNFNPVTNFSEGTYLGGASVYDRPLTSREDDRRYV